MEAIPIQPVPSQILKLVLDDQNCQLAIYQKSVGMFFDLNADGIDISLATICRDAIPLNPRDYAGFSGNFVFIDTMGSDDPQYESLGTRFQLIYLMAAEYALIAGE